MLLTRFTFLKWILICFSFYLYSIKKLKSKNDRKLRQKQHRLAARAAHQDKNEVIAADVPAKRGKV